MTIEPYMESTDQDQIEPAESKSKSTFVRSTMLLLIAFVSMVLPASAAINTTQILADFTAIAAILESTGIIFTALIGLVIILVPLVIVIAIAKFIPEMFQKILDMFKFR